MSATPRTKESKLKKRAKKCTLLLMLLMTVVVSASSGAYNTQAATAEEEAPMNTRKGRTVMYIMDSHNMKLRDEDAHALDQLNYSFALIKDGKADGSHWMGLKKVQAFLKKHPHVDGVVSIGGWGADGFSDAIIPTNPVLLIGLSMANVSYWKWLKWTWKIQLLLFVISVLVLFFGVMIGY